MYVHMSILPKVVDVTEIVFILTVVVGGFIRKFMVLLKCYLLLIWNEGIIYLP